LSKTGLKICYFCQHSKKAKKWPNGQTILFLANSFKKGQIWQIWPLKRPNGNPVRKVINLEYENLKSRKVLSRIDLKISCVCEECGGGVEVISDEFIRISKFGIPNIQFDPRIWSISNSMYKFDGIRPF
jgi:hypothetical protein